MKSSNRYGFEELEALMNDSNTKHFKEATKDDLINIYCKKEKKPVENLKQKRDWESINDMLVNVNAKFPKLKKSQLPYFFFHNLKNVRDKIHNKDSDFMGMAYTNEGGGKTTLGYLTCTAIDPSFNNSRVIFDEQQFKELIHDLIKMICKATGTKTFEDARYKIALDPDKYKHLRGKAIMIDEGVEMLFTRNAMKTGNKDIIIFFTIMRILGLFVWINAVSYALIEKDVRTRRSKMSVVITKKGTFKVISRKRQRNIKYNDVKKTVIYPRVPLMEQFPKLTGEPWAQYEKIKAKYVSKKNSSTIDKMSQKDKPLLPELTERQKQVKDLIDKGHKVKEVSDMINIIPRVIYRHIEAIKKKGYKIS